MKQRQKMSVDHDNYSDMTAISEAATAASDFVTISRAAVMNTALREELPELAAKNGAPCRFAKNWFSGRVFRDAQLSTCQKLVMICVAMHARSDGSTDLTSGDIAELTANSTRTIRSAIASLIELGWLSRIAGQLVAHPPATSG